MRWVLYVSILTALAGCHAYTIDVDGRIAQRASQSIDMPTAPAPRKPPEPRSPVSFGRPTAHPGVLLEDGPHGLVEGTEQRNVTRVLVPITAQIEKAPATKPGGENQLLRRLEFKEDVLGWKIPDVQMWRRGATEKEMDEAIQKQFPPLPAMPKLPEAEPGPTGLPLTLTELQQIALRTNPKIRQAHLDIESARGLALQAGLYPNPNIGYEASTVGQGNTNGKRSPGQEGGFFEQRLVTMGKLTIARHAAQRDVQIMEQNLKQAESDLQTQVRTLYFAVLSARENHRVGNGLTVLADELYSVLLLQMRAGEVAVYEPIQARVLAIQSRQSLTVAQNRYISAWRQLAASLGTPQMPLTSLEGRIDMPVPVFDYDKVLAYVLSNHSEVIAAQLGADKSRFLLRLAEVQAFPDLTLHTAVQKDYTTPPFGTVANVNVSLPFPLWNRNQGNLQSNRAQLRKAIEENLRVRNDLAARVAAVFERYTTSRELLKMYKDHLLPNQVQAFRAALARPSVEKSANFGDVIASQQSLAPMIGSYLIALHEQWSSVVDISSLLQSTDLFQTQPHDEVTPIPDVYELYRNGPRHRR